MERSKFIEHLKKYPHLYEFEEKNDNGDSGILIKDNEYNTLTFFTDEAIREGELIELLKQTHHGKNVEWISRVTGYFSKINSWNKGKREEFKDRYRASNIGAGVIE
ncbi:MAG TPA: anaerobic ribonucleoside-triphosphate reductase [bacterium]|nr:anaerobic ribonucleoside-triphosphate reductase [bacterium]HOL35135.1 anaerobic ribonucleoside-triphosphate reductase [bacterium]HPP08562.1 anaerobic ribonucleoside-triphosphate reductase [bacterium]